MEEHDLTSALDAFRYIRTHNSCMVDISMVLPSRCSLKRALPHSHRTRIRILETKEIPTYNSDKEMGPRSIHRNLEGREDMVVLAIFLYNLRTKRRHNQCKQPLYPPALNMFTLMSTISIVQHNHYKQLWLR